MASKDDAGSLGDGSGSTRLSSSGSPTSSGGDSWSSSKDLSERPVSRGRAIPALVAVALLLAWAWSRYILRVAKRPTPWGRGWPVAAAWAFLVSLRRWLGLRMDDEVFQRPEALGEQCILGVHPHGLYALAPIFQMCPAANNPKSGIFGFYALAATACFQVPFYRELLCVSNVRIADGKLMDELLASGKSVALCPGGIHEQLATVPSRERVYFPSNLGFVRKAIRHGVPLVPLYNFGENQLYNVPSWSRSFSAWLKRRFRAGFPFGVGRWGLPFLPLETTVRTRVGRRVDVGPAERKPSEERVKEVFLAYCAELRRLFEEHKDSALPPDVASRGLEIIWRGHDKEGNALRPPRARL